MRCGGLRIIGCESLASRRSVRTRKEEMAEGIWFDGLRSWVSSRISDGHCEELLYHYRISKAYFRRKIK